MSDKFALVPSDEAVRVIHAATINPTAFVHLVDKCGCATFLFEEKYYFILVTEGMDSLTSETGVFILEILDPAIIARIDGEVDCGKPYLVEVMEFLMMLGENAPADFVKAVDRKVNIALFGSPEMPTDFGDIFGAGQPRGGRGTRPDFGNIFGSRQKMPDMSGLEAALANLLKGVGGKAGDTIELDIKSGSTGTGDAVVKIEITITKKREKSGVEKFFDAIGLPMPDFLKQSIHAQRPQRRNPLGGGFRLLSPEEFEAFLGANGYQAQTPKEEPDWLRRLGEDFDNEGLPFGDFSEEDFPAMEDSGDDWLSALDETEQLGDEEPAEGDGTGSGGDEDEE